MQIVRICLSGGFDLQLSAGGEYAEVRIAGPFRVVTSESQIVQVNLAGDTAPPFATLYALLFKEVTRCDVRVTGQLEIDIEGAGRLEVRSQQDYEAWEIAGPSGNFVVALPGGEVSMS